MPLFPPNAKRVAYATNNRINDWIEDEAMERVESYKDADAELIHQRLYELDCEWDVERLVETESSALVVAGVALGFLHSPKWFLVAGFGGLSLLQHALTGWCPSTPVMRRLGVRTSEEICYEKQLLEEYLEER